jgi:hypothetical protein
LTSWTDVTRCQAIAVRNWDTPISSLGSDMWRVKKREFPRPVPPEFAEYSVRMPAASLIPPHEITEAHSTERKPDPGWGEYNNPIANVKADVRAYTAVCDSYWADARHGIIIEGMDFYTDSVALSYADIQGAKQWWINAFDCKVATVPPDWDNPLPSDVALKLPGNDEPTILLSGRKEVEQAGFDRPSPVVSVIFCDKLKKAYEQLSSRGILVGPIQDGDDTQFFEIRDTEGNLVQICKEP